MEQERRNNLYINNGNAFDEQISGIGEILEDIKSEIASIAENILRLESD